MVEGYLDRRRRRIALALLVVDSRHAVTELDLTMKQWLEVKEIEYVVAATKSDKLSASGRARKVGALLEEFGASTVCERPILVSAQTGRGIRELWHNADTALDAWWKRMGRDSGDRTEIPGS